MTTGEGGIVVTGDPALCAADGAVHRQGLGLRRSEARPLLPGAQLPHDRARRARWRWRSSTSSTAWSSARVAMADRLDRADRRARRASRRRTSPPGASTPTGSTRCASTRPSIRGGADALRRAAQGGGRLLRAALHPEAGLRVRRCCATSARSARAASRSWASTARASPRSATTRARRRGRSRRWRAWWCCPGTSATPRSTSTTSPGVVRDAADGSSRM